MAVRFWDVGEHKGGFVGFCVSRSVYGSRASRQKYFPLSRYSYTNAWIAAHAQELEWKEEAEALKLQSRRRTASSNRSTGDADAMEQSLSSLVKLMVVANEAEILSTWHLTVFIECAKQEGDCLYDIFGVTYGDAGYKRVYAAVRQLMHGESSRKAGLSLLDWGESTQGKVKAIILTHKGYELFSKMKALL